MRGLDMEITLVIDGKPNVFKQDKVNFKTMKKLIDYQDLIQAEVESFKILAEHDINDDVIDEIEEKTGFDYDELIDTRNDLELSADIIVKFFNQFTYEQFVNGAEFDSANAMYNLVGEIFDLAFGSKQDNDKKQGKKLKKNRSEK